MSQKFDYKSGRLTWDGEALWMIDRDGRLVSYDRGGQRLRRLALPISGPAEGLVWVAGQLWIVDEFGTLTRFTTDKEF